MTKISEYRKLLSLKEESDYQLREIKSSEKYVNFEMLIKALQEDQKELLSGVIDYSEAIQDLEQEIIEEAKAKGVYATDEMEIKFKKTKKVNVSFASCYMSNEDFIRIAKITMVDFKDYIAENEHKENELKTCIEYGQGKATGLILKD